MHVFLPPEFILTWARNKALTIAFTQICNASFNMEGINPDNQ